MGRLIDADRFIEDVGLDGEDARENNLGVIVTLEDFDRQPTVDAEQVRHGKWIDVNPIKWECSECGDLVYRYNNSPFCPNCGAKMDLKLTETLSCGSRKEGR